MKIWRSRFIFVFLSLILFFVPYSYSRTLSPEVLDALEYAYELGGDNFTHQYESVIKKIEQGVCKFPQKTVEKVCVEALRVFYAARLSLDNDIDHLTSMLEHEVVRGLQLRAARPSSQTNGITSTQLQNAQRVRDLDVERDLNVGRRLTAQEIDVSGTTSNLNVANLSVANTATINSAVIDTATIQGTFTAQNGYYFNTGVPGLQANLLQVTKGSLAGPNQFNSVKAAVDSITDASAMNPYVVEVGPGLYFEDTITLKPFVAVVGHSASSTFVMASSSSNDVFIGAPDSYLANIFITGATDSDKSGVVFNGDATGHLFVVKDCSFGANYRQVSILSSSGNLANVLVASCVFVDDFVRGFHIDGTTGRVFASIGSILWDVEDATLLSELGFVTGPLTRMRMINSCFASVASLAGDGFVVQNGANCTIETSRFCNVNRALYVPNVGAGPDIFLQAFSAFKSTEDIRIDNPLTEAVVKGIIDWDKTVIDPSVSISLLTLDPNPSGGIVTVGTQQAGGTVGSVTNITPIMEDGSSLGVISGGELSPGVGLQVSVTSGTGYISEPTLKYISWNAATLALPANEDSFIFVNQDGDVVSSLSEPSSYTSILIGKARTNASGIAFIQLIKQEAQHTATQLDESWRLALGSVYNTGSLVTKNGDIQLDVSSGRYFFSTHEYNPSGGTAISWEAFYRDGGGNFNVVNQNSVDYNHYDDSTGVLATIPVNNFARHALYIVNDGADEKYLFVYAQQTYPTLLDAQNGVIPSEPGTWTGNITLIASIIVKNSATPSEQVSEIRDERPTLGFKASGVSVTNVHGNLQGLTADDHKQYLLVNGTRAMADSLNMGGYSVTNVDLVDGVDVSDHGASRHIPNGLDPLPTAAPVTIGTSNQEGIQNSFARSDHVHNHGDLGGGSLHADATTTVDGFMSAADKTKLDSLDPALFVLKAGDTMTGTLNFNAAGSNALVVNTDKLVVDNDTGNTSIAGTLGVTGQTTLSNLSSTGVVHNNVSGVLSTSLIVNSDVDAAANIADTKLATISTAGKVSNSATTADSANTASAIVARDGLGNFSAGTISADLTGDVTGSVTGAASLNVLKAGDTMSGTLAISAGASNALNVNSGKFTIDSTTGNTNIAGTLGVTGQTTLSNLSSTGVVHNNASGVLSTSLIVNADVDAAANIADTKLATISTTGKVSNSATTATNLNTASAIVARDGSGNFNAGTISSNLTGNVTGSVTGAASLNVLKSGDTMSGDLNMGGQSITNVNLVDGVDVPAHASRHNPGGADALATAVPVTIATANSEGTAASFARSDHVHSHGNLAGGALHADATTTVDGFMSAADKTKLDGLQPGGSYVLKSGDSMSGTLTISAGASNALNVNGGKFAIDSTTGNTSVAGTLGVTGQTTLSNLSSTGVVHNNASGILSTSLIVNADVDPAADIVDTKLATISTAGKVSNSATTATNLNTASAIVARDGSGNFNAGTISADLTGDVTGSVTGAASLNVLKAGDTMSGALNINVGGANALNINSGKLTVNGTSGDTVIAGTLGITGQTTLSNLSSSGVVHTNASGVLSTSLIVDADVNAAAGIVDTKLATISTAGKVSNSATTATSTNTINAIVARDGSGNFNAGTITASLTGAASLNVLKAGDTMSGDLNMGGQSITNVNLVDGVDVPAHASRHNPGGADALTTAAPVTIATANSEGAAASFARSDHVHNHGNLAGGALHADATTTVDGFMSAADKTKLDGLQPGGSYVLKAGDTMSGALNINVGGANALNINSGKLTVNGTSGDTVIAGTLGVTGQATLSSLSSAGVVHTNASGVLSTSLIVDADVNAAANIADTKLATISTAGKVSNSATTATSTNTINAIVARDGSGNFNAGTITASLTGAASLNVLKAGDTMSGDLNMGGQSITNVNLVDGVDVPAHASRHNPGGADALTTAAPVTIATANSEGTAASFARSDHVHSHGNLAGGALHADATTTVDGFMSATDKTKLDGLQPGGSYVLKAGDTMSGALNINVGGANALNVNSGKLTVNGTSGDTVIAGTLGVTGQTTLSNLSSAGVVHTNASGVLSTSLIVDADVNAAANIADTKLATISTAGKVSNSATTATNLNTASAIVARDGSGNFNAGTISADLTGDVTGSVTGAASLNVLKAGDTMSGTLNFSAGGSNAINVNSGKFIVDNDSGDTTIARNLYLPVTSSATAGIVYRNSIPFIHDSDTSDQKFSLYVGSQSGNLSPSGVANSNTGLGYKALTALNVGNNNVSIGHGASSLITTGANNIAIGRFAHGGVTSGESNNTAVGDQAMRYASGSSNVAVGANALDGASGSPSTGSQNVALGVNALSAASMNSDDNVAVGWNVLATSTGANNVAVGSGAGDIVTTGSQNVLVGKDAGGGLITGYENTLLGYSAGSNIITGTGNVVIGAGTLTSGGGYNEIIIGDGASGVANDTTVIGNAHTVGCYIKGIDGVTVSGGTTVYIDSDGHLGTSTSSRRFKENIETVEERDSDLMQLRPVQFNYIADETKRMQYGLIAEEVEDVYPELVSYDQESGLARGVLYDNFISLLISRIQRQESRISYLEEVVQEFLER